LLNRAAMVGSDDPALTNPTIGIDGCWARAATGHVAAALPTNLMKSRRLIASPGDRTRESLT
jgi:hypothetical protein